MYNIRNVLHPRVVVAFSFMDCRLLIRSTDVLFGIEPPHEFVAKGENDRCPR